MTSPVLFLLVCLCMLLACQGPLQAQELDAYRWQHRLLLVFASDSSDASLLAQNLALASVAEGMQERDLLLLSIHPGGSENFTASTCARLYRRFGVAEGDFSVMLIGKDGGEKYRANQPILPELLFGLIDAMPMRQSEMRKP